MFLYIFLRFYTGFYRGHCPGKIRICSGHVLDMFRAKSRFVPENYLCFGKPHRLKSDERKEERKRGTKYERKSLKSGKEERIGTEKSEEQKRGTKEERKSLKKGKEEQNRKGQVCTCTMS